MFQIELEKYMLKIRFLYLSIFLLLGCSSNQLESKVLEFNTPRIAIEDKIAQMIMIRMDGKYHSNDSWKKSYIEDIIKEYNIGCLITFTGNVHGTFANIKKYQDIAKTPMFIGIYVFSRWLDSRLGTNSSDSATASADTEDNKGGFG